MAWAHGVSLPEAAIAWPLHRGAVTAVVNCRTDTQVRENAGSAELALSVHELELLGEAFSLP